MAVVLTGFASPSKMFGNFQKQLKDVPRGRFGLVSMDPLSLWSQQELPRRRCSLHPRNSAPAWRVGGEGGMTMPAPSPWAPPPQFQHSSVATPSVPAPPLSPFPPPSPPPPTQHTQHTHTHTHNTHATTTIIIQSGEAPFYLAWSLHAHDAPRGSKGSVKDRFSQRAQLATSRVALAYSIEKQMPPKEQPWAPPHCVSGV